MTRFGVIELGGTKALASVGTTAADLAYPIRISTTDPESTIDALLTYLEAHSLESVGIATFGPIELRKDHPDFGRITNTPKPDWRGYPLLERVNSRLGIPVGIETDVNGAALGEGEWGAARGLKEFSYVTVGTGIGTGTVLRGRPIGVLGHAEMGHIVVQQHPDDQYPGRCPSHRNCLEGLASGPALEDRFGPAASWSDPTVPLSYASYYLAQGLRNLVYTSAPERIIVGGGVSKIPGFHTHLSRALVESMNGYPGLTEHTDESFVVAPRLGDRSGLAGALLLAAASAP